MREKHLLLSWLDLWLLLLLSHHLLLLKNLGLFRGQLHLLLLVDHSSWHLWLLLLLNLITFTVTLLWSAVLTLVFGFESILVEVTLVSLTLVVRTMLSVSAILVLTRTSHHTVTTLTTGRMIVEIFHEVLLNFVEAALLALLVQLLCGHPELH